jgi:hypothetical protein
MWIEYSNNQYNGDPNLRELISVSGEYLDGNNVAQVNESQITQTFDDLFLMLWDITNQEIIPKTDNQRKLERLIELRTQVQISFRNIYDAISFQQAVNMAKIDDSESPVYTFSKQDIKNIGNYINNVFSFDQTWDPDDYTLDSNGDLYLTSDSTIKNKKIFNGSLTLPAILQQYLI